MENKQGIFNIYEVWNTTLGMGKDRPVEPRDRMWASELWKQNLDIVLKLKGVQPTNEPNARAIRKMEMGNLIENNIKSVLLRAGILQRSQTRVERVATDKEVAISGKLDFEVGGKPNPQQLSDLAQLEIPEEFINAGQKIAEYLNEKYPDGLEEMVVECKSTSLMAFDRIMALEKPLAGHDLQLFHYVYNLGKRGVILYFCKDDARMMSFIIEPDNKELEARYLDKLRQVKHYLDTDTLPKKEPVIIWDEINNKFSQNLNVRYSSFLTKNYKLNDESEYEEIISPVVSSWNRVLTRIKKGQDMTAKNDAHLQDMAKMGYDGFALLGKTRETYKDLPDAVVEVEEEKKLPTFEELVAEANVDPLL